MLNRGFKAVSVNPRVLSNEVARTALALHQTGNVPRSVQHPHDFQRRGPWSIYDGVRSHRPEQYPLIRQILATMSYLRVPSKSLTR